MYLSRYIQSISIIRSTLRARNLTLISGWSLDAADSHLQQPVVITPLSFVSYREMFNRKPAAYAVQMLALIGVVLNKRLNKQAL